MLSEMSNAICTCALDQIPETAYTISILFVATTDRPKN